MAESFVTPVALPSYGSAARSLGCLDVTENACNLMLIGLGPHARRTYVPHVQKHAASYNARLRAVVELESARPEVERICRHYSISADRVYVAPFPAEGMPAEICDRLDSFVARHRINGVIISSEPLAHRVYLDYALQRGLNILVDKPLTTRPGVAHDLAQARGIWDDYRDIRSLYEQGQSRRGTCLLVNSHRRYHPGFLKAFELIAEIRDRFGCPVTGISSEHCDGQWRLPAEIVTQAYHPYNRGYGKVSHSGYHAIDMLTCFLEAGDLPGKAPDALTISSSFVLPSGFLRQVNREDYRRCFGPIYDEICPTSDAEFHEQVAGFGEIDATALLEFSRLGDVVVQATITLQHNGFSRRTWVRPGTDLYKGNGRVRHERHKIVSGPFQTLYIESYQANDNHDRSGTADFGRGGNNHFDLVVYRNCGLTGDKEPQQVYHLEDLPAASSFDASLLSNEQVKAAALVEFLQFLRGEIALDQLRSNIDGHALTVRIMSAMYESHVLRQQGGDGWVKMALGPIASGGLGEQQTIEASK